MSALADVLDHFNNVDDDEVLRLYAQANSLISRLEGSSSVNVAIGVQNLADAYNNRAKRAKTVNDLNRCIANFELAVPHYFEAARIFRVINHVDGANDSLRIVAQIEESIRRVRITIAASSRG